MSHIEKVIISNYKCFQNTFTISLKDRLNIIVGNNEAGKSTILEAIHLALSGLLNGRYLKNELTQYIFNKEIEKEYIKSLSTAHPLPPPEILIEIYFSGDSFPGLEGDGNSTKSKASGIRLSIEFDEDYKTEYDSLTKSQFQSIPIEYYKLTWTSFSRDPKTSRSIPVKSVLIDSTSTRYQNGSDVYISKIIRDDLVEMEIIELSQAYRKLKENFTKEQAIIELNKRITQKAAISSKEVTVSVDLSPKNSWETTLMTYLDEIPFHQIGKGEQCLIKTNLALAHKKTTESNLILIEEPENHLSHSKLNEFLKNIIDKCGDKQIIVTTHSSYIANKLSLQNLILLNDQKQVSLTALKPDTFDFFSKLPGYQTLRMLLSKKTILVEGPSDELIVQRCYMDKHQKNLPIEKGVDVISVGLAFKRFLEVAELVALPVAVLTDNDGNYLENILKKYESFKNSPKIKICYDENNDLRTLEPQIVAANKDNLDEFCEIIGIDPNNYKNPDEISEYMIKNKTDYALKIFSSGERIMYPDYIIKAVDWCDED